MFALGSVLPCLQLLSLLLREVSDVLLTMTAVHTAPQRQPPQGRTTSDSGAICQSTQSPVESGRSTQAALAQHRQLLGAQEGADGHSTEFLSREQHSRVVARQTAVEQLRLSARRAKEKGDGDLPSSVQTSSQNARDKSKRDLREEKLEQTAAPLLNSSSVAVHAGQQGALMAGGGRWLPVVLPVGGGNCVVPGAELLVLLQQWQQEALGELYTVVTTCHDYVRRPMLIPYFQTLAFLCSQKEVRDARETATA